MKTIKERAQSYTDKVGILGAYQGYIAGATEQRAIDIDKACEWLKENADKYIYDAEVSRYQPPQLTISGKCWEDFRKAMEG